jgi:Phosphodiester glycosidase
VNTDSGASAARMHRVGMGLIGNQAFRHGLAKLPVPWRFQAVRRELLLFFIMLTASCSPVAVEPAPRAAPVVHMQKPVSPAPSQPARAPEVTRSGMGGIEFEGVTFDSRTHRLVVVDQRAGPGSQYATAADAGAGSDGIMALNAGFFTPEGMPLGLVVSAGKVAGSWNGSSSLGSGIWFEDSSGSPSIRRREDLGKSAAQQTRELIQSGPMLVENGRSVGGLESQKTSARSVILWDGGTRWWLGRGSPCTLAVLAHALAGTGPAGWKVRHALNLDGGRSVDLWISPAVSGGPAGHRPPWNRAVRNFLVLRAL